MGKKYFAFLQFMIIIDMSQILKRNVNFSILTFQNNALYWKTLVLCPIHFPNILITFSKEDIYKIIKNLDPNEAHVHDMISICKTKLCSISIGKPLEIIFQNFLRWGTFPSEWKKANVVPTFKKSDKQCIKNYRPVSLLPVCAKVFERLFLNNMFSFFHKMT